MKLWAWKLKLRWLYYKERRQAFSGLEVLPVPLGLSKVVWESGEMLGVCPKTGQPDWYWVRIEYTPSQFILESRSLRLLLASFRSVPMFCEAVPDALAQRIEPKLLPKRLTISVTQKLKYRPVQITAFYES